jgi:replication factor C subunit 3/5
MDKLPWTEKYRPTDMDSIASHGDILKTLNNFINAKVFPNLLFYGPSGTGKTTTILACANKIYKNDMQSQMIIHLNASDERGIDVVRQTIKDFATTRAMFSNNFKLVILDEADSMTDDAQLALREIIGKYSTHTRFCLICNYINKILPELQSRFVKFRFVPVRSNDIIDRAKMILDKENVKYDKRVFDNIYMVSNGDMRRYINILQLVSSNYDIINVPNLYKFVCKPERKHIISVLSDLLNENFTTCYNNVIKMTTENGLSLKDLIYELYNYIMNDNTVEKPRKNIRNKVEMKTKKKSDLDSSSDSDSSVEIVSDGDVETDDELDLSEMSEEMFQYITLHLADLEHNLTYCSSEKIQITGFVSVFLIAREV